MLVCVPRLCFGVDLKLWALRVPFLLNYDSQTSDQRLSCMSAYNMYNMY